jgi:hypothetical protein
MYNKRALRIGFERFRWNTVVGTVERIAQTSWCRAAQGYGGSVRLLSLAQDLGLKGDFLKSARLQLTLFDRAGDSTTWEDEALDAVQRGKLRIPLPFGANGFKASNVMGSVVFKNALTDNQAVEGVGRQSLFRHIVSAQVAPAFSGLPEDLVEYRKDWIIQAKIASVVAQFAEEHVPYGFDAVRDTESRALCFVDKETGAKEPLTRLAREAASEAARIIVTLSTETTSLTSNLGFTNPSSILSVFLSPSQEASDNEDGSVKIDIQTRQLQTTAGNGLWSRFQRFSRTLVCSKVWKSLVVAVIILSCAVVLVTPRDTEKHLFSIVEYICTMFFFVEVLLVIGRGSETQWNHGGVRMAIQIYFKNGWNCLDFLIVGALCTAPLARHFSLGFAYSTCRVISGFRPLRLINRVKRMKDTLKIISKSIRSLSTLGVFVFFAMTAWAIVGMQLLKGLFNGCNDGIWAEDAEYQASVGSFPANRPMDGIKGENGTFTSRPCFGNYTNATGFPLEAKGDWVNAPFHFDNFPNSLMSLFTFCVGGWGNIFLRGLAVTSVDYSPESYHNKGIINLDIIDCYFFLGVAFFNFYIPNESLAVIFHAYSEDKVKKSPPATSVQERKIIALKDRIHRLSIIKSPKLPTAKWRQAVYRFTESDLFVKGIFTAIVLNATALASEYQGQLQLHGEIIDWLELVLAAIFILEVVLKILGSGISAYFFRSSNVFDFGISALSSLDSFFFVLGLCHKANSALVRWVRSMRILRVLRILNMVRGFEIVMLVISCVGVHIITVVQLLTILIFIFANIGVVLFGAFSSTGSRYANFESEWSSMQLLFVLMTGEGWTDFMVTMVESNESSSLRVVAVFVIFLTLSKLILENLFVMVLFSGFWGSGGGFARVIFGILKSCFFLLT